MGRRSLRRKDMERLTLHHHHTGITIRSRSACNLTAGWFLLLWHTSWRVCQMFKMGWGFWPSPPQLIWIHGGSSFNEAETPPPLGEPLKGSFQSLQPGKPIKGYHDGDMVNSDKVTTRHIQNISNQAWTDAEELSCSGKVSRDSNLTGIIGIDMGAILASVIFGFENCFRIPTCKSFSATSCASVAWHDGMSSSSRTAVTN